MSWQEIRDKHRLWCKIDAERCLLEIVHRGIIKVVDLEAYGLIYVGKLETVHHEGYKLSPQGEDQDTH